MIRTRQLSYSYPKGPTLAFPDVDVLQGGVLLLGGPSGAGKSTWLALAAGLVAPTTGQLDVAGQSLGAGRTGLKKPALDCPFCIPGGPESMVEVKSKRPVKYSMEPVVVEGRFLVLPDDSYGLYYRITDATSVN